MRRWFRWVTRISLGLAIPIVFVVAFIILNPLGAVILLYSLVGNTHPPAIAEDQFAGASWPSRTEASAKLTTLLQRKFPVGTSEDALRATLSSQGFKPLSPPPADCLPAGQPAPIGRAVTTCPTHDQSKILEYRWGVVCGETITIRWWTDDRHAITGLDAAYYVACL
ncbi:hypothetical protein [Taklimakanibacter deserti]|uniref:hypothetical protein n=1 Tax=Taklimakanibacter deserti TaxID=2267839 RepID=UPI000E6554EC